MKKIMIQVDINNGDIVDRLKDNDIEFSNSKIAGGILRIWFNSESDIDEAIKQEILPQDVKKQF